MQHLKYMSYQSVYLKLNLEGLQLEKVIWNNPNVLRNYVIYIHLLMDIF